MTRGTADGEPRVLPSYGASRTFRVHALAAFGRLWLRLLAVVALVPLLVQWTPDPWPWLCAGIDARCYEPGVVRQAIQRSPFFRIDAPLLEQAHLVLDGLLAWPPLAVALSVATLVTGVLVLR